MAINQQWDSQHLTLMTPAIVALAIATILSTERVEPNWLNGNWAIVAISISGGAVAALMEVLAAPDVIHALVWNRHRYQRTRSFQEGSQPTQVNNRNRRRRPSQN